MRNPFSYFSSGAPTPDPSPDSNPPTVPLTGMTPPGAADHDDSVFTSKRSRSQLQMWAAGSLFMLFSAGITRRAIIRRNNWTRPTYFQHNDQAPVTLINGPLEALEALSVATINTLSFAIMFTGGMFWAFDISSVQEWRERTRAKLGYETSIAAEAEKEKKSLTHDEWIASVLIAEDEVKEKKTKR